MAFGLTGDTWGLVQTIVLGALLFAIGILLIDSLLTAGWAYMNKRVVIDGRATLGDLWAGAKKYFIRILVGRIVVGVILVLPAIVGIIAVTASILALNVRQLMPPVELTPATTLSLLAAIIFGLLGIILVVALVEIVLYIFLLPWMQALVMDDLGVMKSIRSSFVFSQELRHDDRLHCHARNRLSRSLMGRVIHVARLLVFGVVESNYLCQQCSLAGADDKGQQHCLLCDFGNTVGLLHPTIVRHIRGQNTRPMDSHDTR